MALSHILKKIREQLVELTVEWDEEATDVYNQLEHIKPKSLSGRALNAKGELFIQCATQIEHVIDNLDKLAEIPVSEEEYFFEKDQEIEDVIADWYFDQPSYEFAKQLCTFLFEFIDAVEEEGLSKQTIQKHRDNCWSIGELECDYGNHEMFSPTIFLCEPSFLSEFRREYNDSLHAINSYKTTWRKLRKFTRSSGYTGEDVDET
ncbi:MAG: hypothetical protein D3905_03625 [Candidatus Electrothrix sp. AS4_5]|nr:hypothetical protein [Candidatus Electrothrix gigas]